MSELPSSQDVSKDRIEEKMEDLRRELYLAVSQMSKEIFEKPYSLVIGDDASGRLATIAIAEFMKIIYTNNNIPVPAIKFFKGSGGREIGSDEKVARINNIEGELLRTSGKNMPGRILVVTDTIENGLGISALTMALTELKIPFDILTTDINTENNEGIIDKQELRRRVDALKDATGATNIFYGSMGVSTLNREYDIHGVIGDKGGGIYSRPTINYAKGENGYGTIRSEINESRKQAHEIARYLAEELGDKIKFEFGSEADI